MGQPVGRRPAREPRFEIRRPKDRAIGQPGRVIPLVVPPITVLRTGDLLLARFSFHNLRRDDAGGVHRLRRRDAESDAFLVLHLPPQHIAEQAFPEKASVLPAAPPGPNEPPRTNDSEPPVMPVIAISAADTRLAFRVTDETIEFTLAGLLRACATLPLSVAPHAVNPRRRLLFREVLADPAFDVVGKLKATGGTALRADAVIRSVAAARILEHRLGTDAALATAAGLQITDDLQIADALSPSLGAVVQLLKPVPKPATDTQTSIELPWRLAISPSTDGGFTHALDPVEHDDRVELWHTRFGIRTVRSGPAGDHVLIDEDADRTVRAIWTRDFTVFPQAADDELTNIPDADGSDDQPLFRSSLNSRDRMMLVHETSNFRQTAGGARGHRRRSTSTG